jgi:hypothetical protein
MVPEAAAAGQLFVSAENALFNNHFAGTSIVEIIVKDPNANRTDIQQPEPTVKVNENKLRMAQALDGNWYGYIADKTDAATAFAERKQLDQRINLGIAHTAVSIGATPAFDSAAVVYHTSAIIGGAPLLSKILTTGGIQTNGVGLIGQSGVDNAKWPMIQAFDFTTEEFEVKLEQPGADEIVILTHNNVDIDDYSSLVLDRTAATNGAQIHLTITDQALNIDPTTEDQIIFNVTAGSEGVSFKAPATETTGSYVAFNNNFDDNGKLIINYKAQSTATYDVLDEQATLEDVVLDKYIVFNETAENSGIFNNTDDADNSTLIVGLTAERGTTATFDYNDSAQSFVVAHDFATIDMDASSVGDEWNSGEEMTITLYDQDLNLNTQADEDLTVLGGTLVPSIQIGSPLSLTTGASVKDVGALETIIDDDPNTSGINPAAFSKIATVDATELVDGTSLLIDTGIGYAAWNTFVAYDGTEYINYHLSALTSDVTAVQVGTVADPNMYATSAGTDDADLTAKDYEGLVMTTTAATAGNVYVTFSTTDILITNDAAPFYVDFFSLGDAVNHAIYRIELEETGDNTAEFSGSAEYVMLNQLNNVAGTFAAANPTQDDVDMIVHLDMTDEDSIRVNYLDLGADGVSTQIADQEAAPTHSGTADLDMDSYKIADTVVVTIDDQDLNTNSELIDVYITTDGATSAADKVGLGASSHVMDITFNDIVWNNLYAQGFTLVETGIATGIFQGSFQVPETFDDNLDDDTGIAGGSTTAPVAVTGTDIEVNYNDHRDLSGNTIEVGDGASIRANTGSVTFDRTVYPVPWDSTAFAEHATATNDTNPLLPDYLPVGDVVVHISVEDSDYDISAIGQDSINSKGVVSVTISRGNLVTADLITENLTTGVTILETAPDSAIFEYDLTLASGVLSSNGVAPNAFASGAKIQQGDIITVVYTDPQDASGKIQTVTDSSSFDLRNGTLQLW